MTSKLWIFPILIFGVLVLFGASSHSLWSDEAGTAVLARSILQNGVPHGWDGTNILSNEINGESLNGNLINNVSSYPQLYLAALSIKAFGSSNFSVRLPFVIFSILSVVAVYFLAIKLFGKPRLAFLSVFILSLNVPFILFSYQARYYSVLNFGAILAILSLLNLNKTWGKLGLLTGCLIIIFNNYSIFPAFIFSLFISGFIFKKISSRKQILTLIVIATFSVLAFLPIIYLNDADATQQGFYFGSMIIPGFFATIVAVLFQLNQSNIFPVLLLVVSSVFIIKEIRKPQTSESKSLLFMLAFLTLYLIFVGIFSSITTSFSLNFPLSQIRYHIFLFPILSLILAYLINLFFQKNKIIGVSLLLVLLFTNLLSLGAPRIFLLDFIHELSSPYPQPGKIVADYLNSHAVDGQTAFVNLEREHMPLIFYLDRKIRFVNRIHPANQKFFPKYSKLLPRYIYFYNREPDWVIFYSKKGNDGSFFMFDSRGQFPLGLPPSVNLSRDYKETVLPVYFYDTTRPEMDSHAFTPVKPAHDNQIFIYQRLK